MSEAAPLSVLLIEDDALDARLIREHLQEARETFRLIHVNSVDAAQPLLADPAIGAILLDLHLPGISELAAVAAVHAGSAGQPILVMTGRSQTDLGVDALRLGAQDYLIKDDLSSGTLLRAIRHAIERQNLLSCMRDSVRASNCSEENLRRLLLQGTEALLVVGSGGRVHFANQLAEKLLAMTSAELADWTCTIPADPAAEIEHEIVRPDGTRVLAELRSVEVRWRERPAILISLRDVSERRAAKEQELRFDLLTEFLGNMSHELRTPLSAIYQFVSNVRDGILGPVNEPQAEQLGAALRNVDEVLSMVGNLLEVSRSQAAKLRFDPRVIDLRAEALPVCDVLASSAREARLRFVVELPHELPRIVADPVRVRQIVSNLTENAIKFTPVGGEVRISAHVQETGRRVILAVEDTGCGVPPEHLDRIFDQLHQVPDSMYRTRRGLGLGLYITRELVRGLGGEIHVASEPGRGSRFEISLPVFDWNEYLAALPEGDPPVRELHGLLVTLAWADGTADEPIPVPFLTAARAALADLSAFDPHVVIPSVAVDGCVHVGALVRAPLARTEALAAELVSRLHADAGLRTSALEVRASSIPLGPPLGPSAHEQLTRQLSRAFFQSNARELPCRTPA